MFDTKSSSIKDEIQPYKWHGESLKDSLADAINQIQDVLKQVNVIWENW